MNKERYNQIIDEIYTDWCDQQKVTIRGEIYKLPIIFSKEELINKFKSDSLYSTIWGLKIEERELSLEERHYTLTKIKLLIPISDDIKDNWIEILNEKEIPTKLITVTYNNETIESYE